MRKAFVMTVLSCAATSCLEWLTACGGVCEGGRGCQDEGDGDWSG